jgi:sialate O-acetylesterase
MKNRHSTAKFFALASSIFISTFTAHAADDEAKPKSKPAIELGTPFSDNAVLQREMPLPVWGWSKPGTKVTVAFGGQKKSATAADDGKWMLKLDPLKANAAAQQMMITESTGKKRTLENILVGEVWMASGQSNMQWNVSKCDVGRVLLAGITERVVAGTEKAPLIREGLVTNYFAHLHPIEHAEGKWSDAGPTSSAIAFAFAYKLHKELDVPIGILNCSFSQTAIQAWVPRSGFKGGKDPYTKAIYQKILQTDPTTPEHKAAWNGFYQSIEDVIKQNEELVKNGKPAKAVPTKTPGNMSGNRDATWLFNARLNPMIPYAIRGAIWNQGYANMNEGLPYYHNLHSMIRGWRELWARPELPVYFHQFYCPLQKGEWNNNPTIGSTAEMRLGTWLARDIPNTGMASQIDITGAIHYSNKTLPGQRLALHALKNQYKKDVVADGPMFKSYEIKGNQLIVTLESTDGGLVIAETGTNSKNGIATPTIVANGDDQVKLFYLAGEDRVWHPASMKIDGNKVIVSSPAVKSPRGVSYATGGIGNQPNIYNKALLPTTPFIYFDNKLVTSKEWPTEKLKIAGEVIDPNSIGKKYEYRKMPLLSTQFRENAVLQAGVPLKIWGSAVHDWGHEAEGKAVVKFSFAGSEKIIPVTSGMKEWQVTLPAMKASAEPKTLKVTFEIDGELIHQRICKNIVIGDVYYVAAPPLAIKFQSKAKSSSIVRMMTNRAKRFSKASPSRFSVCVSTTPLNRFAATWGDASGFAAALGHSIGSKTGNPVGIIFMQTKQSKKSANPVLLKSWIKADDLNQAPSLMADYKDLGAAIPGNPFYNINARNYIGVWKKYWSEYVPAMMNSKRVPDAVPWGSYPALTSSVTSKASEVHNVMVHSFTPATLKGIIFLSSDNMVAADQGANYGPELTALANSFKKGFGNDETAFYYTSPSKALAPKLTQPKGIKGNSANVELSNWTSADGIKKLIEIITIDAVK